MIWDEKQIRPAGLAAEPRSVTSPSAFEVMRGCMYRSGLERDPLYKRDRFPSPQIVIGNATHKLKEIATRGDLGGLSQAERKSAAATLWEEEITKGRSEMVALALGDPPQPEGWPNYQKNRIYAIKDVELSTSTHGFADSDFSANPEVLLNAHDGAITGRVDLIRETADGVEIIDYKTGELAEPGSEAAGEPRLKSGYRRQLLLYAYLYHARFGIWPIMVAAQKANGRQSFSFSPSHSESEALAAEALDLLNQYNQGAKTGALQASPSPDGCRFCPFKAACPSFFEAADEDWDLGGRFSVRGKVASMSHSTRLVTLETTDGNARQGATHIGRIPEEFFDLRSVGDTVSFTDLIGDPGKGLSFLWWSRSWKWP